MGYIGTRAGVKIYVLLNWIMDAGQLENWLKKYKNVIENKIEPKDVFRRTYECIKRHNKLLETFWTIYQ